MDALKTLAQRLRAKESRDNRALLDEAADAIDSLAGGGPCYFCNGGEKVLDAPGEVVEIRRFPKPHLRVTLGDETVGISLNFCPWCGHYFDEEVGKD